MVRRGARKGPHARRWVVPLRENPHRLRLPRATSDHGKRRCGNSRTVDQQDQRTSVVRRSFRDAQLEFSTFTYTLAMLPPQLTQ